MYSVCAVAYSKIYLALNLGAFLEGVKRLEQRVWLCSRLIIGSFKFILRFLTS